MAIEIEEIKGYELFETPTEKERIKTILPIVQDILPDAKIKWLVPNMQKNADGKITTSGFFVFCEEKIIFEFRNFLTAINFDYARYDVIRNIRFLVDSPSSPTATQLHFYHTSRDDLSSLITVFSPNQTIHEFVFFIMKELTKFLKN